MLISNIEFINGVWRGKIKLDSWSHFFEDDEYIDLNIGGDSRVEKLEDRHKLAYEYVVSNQESLLSSILNELKKKYPIMQEEYGYDEDELAKYMPNVNNIVDFKNILNPKRIYILNVESEGIAYVGFHFMCLWDEEHDFGVMMHKERIVKMGGADSAFLSWIAEEDNNVYEQDN